MSRTPVSQPNEISGVPAILLEGDEPPASTKSGPGGRFELGPAKSDRELQDAASVPEEGVGRLALVARDPHWVYAAWDLPWEKQRECNAASRDGHLVMRLFVNGESATPAEVHVQPDSRSWFIQVGHGEASCLAELGFWDHTGHWRNVAQSNRVVTPAESPSPASGIEFASIPPEPALPQLAQSVIEAAKEKSAAPQAEQEVLSAPAEPSPPRAQMMGELVSALKEENDEPSDQVEVAGTKAGPVQEDRLPASAEEQRGPGETESALLEKVRRLRAAGWSALPELEMQSAPPLTEEQARAMSVTIPRGYFHQFRSSSSELQKELEGQEVPPTSPAGAFRAIAQQLEFASIPSSLAPGARAQEKQRSFWLAVNAELVVYGATEPDAQVELAGRKIRLRSDGTFSYRFALPDGKYTIEIRATSAHASDVRQVYLEFARSTATSGTVDAHPQDPSLTTPSEAEFG